jgi:hypothetical protein
MIEFVRNSKNSNIPAIQCLAFFLKGGGITVRVDDFVVVVEPADDDVSPAVSLKN